MLSKPKTFLHVYRHFGLKWLLYRALYAWQIRSGVIRRKMPCSSWATQSLKDFLADPALSDPQTYVEYRRNHCPSFFFASKDRRKYASCLKQWDGLEKDPVKNADRLSGGFFRFFSKIEKEIGLPSDWHENAFTGEKTLASKHWSLVADFGFGDIKVIWEPNRFAFVYDLVRAYWRTGNEAYPELFWSLVEDWREENPPNYGVNWKCGQEISFRVMAWVFGLWGFGECTATTAERVVALAEMIAVSGKRIEGNLDYALSQRNNHGMSEGMGLWTIGLLFPEFRSAKRWRDLGQQVLEKLGRELIYEDGSFVQHSVNYHRLMLHDYVWAMRLGDLNGLPFTDELKDRVAKAGEFFCQIQDKETGRVPYYGQNDGSLVLPLSNCDYQDFRPVIQATRYLSTGKRFYESGPWDEDLLWLFGPDALKARLAAPRRTDLEAEVGGYYTVRSKTGFAFVRCATFRDRPGQADMLHVDLWWRGQNVAMDAGTYSYNAPEPWNNPLARTLYHNTVTVDDCDQMDRISKFVLLPWLQSQVNHSSLSSKKCLACWEGEHNGYQRLKSAVRHRRGILRIGDEHWLVLDLLTSQGEHDYRLHWLFPDVPYVWDDGKDSLTLDTAAGLYHVGMGMLPDVGSCSLIRADEQSPRGWRAPYYGFREPAISVDVLGKADWAFFWTLFGSEPSAVVFDHLGLRIDSGKWEASIALGKGVNQPLIREVAVEGMIQDTLEFQ